MMCQGKISIEKEADMKVCPFYQTSGLVCLFRGQIDCCGAFTTRSAARHTSFTTSAAGVGNHKGIIMRREGWVADYVLVSFFAYGDLLLILPEIFYIIGKETYGFRLFLITLNPCAINRE